MLKLLLTLIINKLKQWQQEKKILSYIKMVYFAIRGSKSLMKYKTGNSTHNQVMQRTKSGLWLSLISSTMRRKRLRAKSPIIYQTATDCARFLFGLEDKKLVSTEGSTTNSCGGLWGSSTHKPQRSTSFRSLATPPGHWLYLSKERLSEMSKLS